MQDRGAKAARSRIRILAGGDKEETAFVSRPGGHGGPRACGPPSGVATAYLIRVWVLDGDRRVTGPQPVALGGKAPNPNDIRYLCQSIGRVQREVSFSTRQALW
jgi:hypothetical protein